MKTYKPNELLNNAINKNELYSVRGALVGILQTDISLHLNEIDNAIRYTELKGICVFEAHNSKYSINESTDQWDREYLAYALTYLHENFSKARLEHAKSVGSYIHSHSTGSIISKSDSRSVINPNQPKQKVDVAESVKAKTYNKILTLIGGVGIVALIIYLISR